MSGASSMESATNAIQFSAGQAGKYFWLSAGRYV